MAGGMPAAENTTRSPAATSLVAGCALSLVIGLAGACLLTGVLALAARGEIVLGQGIANESRLWLIQDDQEAGLGLAWVAPAIAPRPGLACERTRVVFLLWKSSGSKPATEYCECYRATPTTVEYEGACEPQP